MESNQQIILPNEHPLIELPPSAMIMPNMVAPVSVDKRLASQNLLQAIRAGQCPHLFAVMSNPRVKEMPDRYYNVGVLTEASADAENPVIILRGLFRAQWLNLKRIGGPGWDLWVVTSKKIEDENQDDYFIENHQLIRANTIKIKDLLVTFMIRARGFYDFDSRLMVMIVDNFENTDWGDKDAVDNFVWASLASVPDLLQDDKQPFLESTSLPERISLCIDTLKARLKLLKEQKEGVLKDEKKEKRSRRAPVQDSEEPEDLKDPKNKDDEFTKGMHKDLLKKWDKFKQIRDFMNEDARDVVVEDIERLKSFGSPQNNSYEWPKFMKRLDFILGLPWKEETAQESDITKVAQILDEDHYGLDKVKKRICESIAPKILNPEGRGHIICFVGAPGVGKTSLAKSIARALNQKLTRMSVGGVRDEAQIRGHGVTYIGAEPGEILKLMKRCGVRNPVFVIDEIDKLGGMSVSGDPSSAMLEVLDPEQNNSFKDHYAGCGFDLSKVMFIATANVEGNIQPALLDRMETITLPGYLEVEKIEIAKRYLVPRWMKEVGLIQNNVQVDWEENLISEIIRGYTSEAGVRNLERTIATILRKIAREYLESKNKNSPVIKFSITWQKVQEYLGPPKFTKDKAQLTKVGEATGLAWTPVGGDILSIQVVTRPRLQDKKVFARTGMQGQVMQESDEVAMTLIRNRHSSEKQLSDLAFHLHIPEGAVPKDGPSAGVTILSALESRIRGVALKPNLAMTGEIDLMGRVKAVGGIREKIVAAERAGIKEIIMPKDNERNLYDVPREVRDKLKFHFVETTDEVLEIAFPKPA